MKHNLLLLTLCIAPFALNAAERPMSLKELYPEDERFDLHKQARHKAGFYTWLYERNWIKERAAEIDKKALNALYTQQPEAPIQQDPQQTTKTPEQVAEEKAARDALRAQRRQEEEAKAKAAKERKQEAMKDRLAKINAARPQPAPQAAAAAAADVTDTDDDFFTKPLNTFFNPEQLDNLIQNSLSQMNLPQFNGMSCCGILNHTGNTLTFSLLNENNDIYNANHPIRKRCATLIPVHDKVFLKIVINDTQVIHLYFSSKGPLITDKCILLIIVHPKNKITVHIINKNGSINQTAAQLSKKIDIHIEGKQILGLKFPIHES